MCLRRGRQGSKRRSMREGELYGAWVVWNGDVCRWTGQVSSSMSHNHRSPGCRRAESYRQRTEGKKPGSMRAVTLRFVPEAEAIQSPSCARCRHSFCKCCCVALSKGKVSCCLLFSWFFCKSCQKICKQIATKGDINKVLWNINKTLIMCMLSPLICRVLLLFLRSFLNLIHVYLFSSQICRD